MVISPRSRQRIEWLLSHGEELGLSRSTVQRLRWFSFANDHHGNVSLTCRHFGIARSTYLRWAERFRSDGERGLEDRPKSPHHVRRAEVPQHIVEAIREYRKAHPTMGRGEIAESLVRSGFPISPSTVGRIITRYRLFFGERPSHRRKRHEWEEQSLHAEKIPMERNHQSLANFTSLSPSFA